MLGVTQMKYLDGVAAVEKSQKGQKQMLIFYGDFGIYLLFSFGKLANFPHPRVISILFIFFIENVLSFLIGQLI